MLDLICCYIQLIVIRQFFCDIHMNTVKSSASYKFNTRS